MLQTKQSAVSALSGDQTCCYPVPTPTVVSASTNGMSSELTLVCEELNPNVLVVTERGFNNSNIGQFKIIIWQIISTVPLQRVEDWPSL